MVQVVLRASRSISPDCSAVKRSLAVSGVNFTLVASLKIADGDRPAIVDVEARPFAGVVGRGEAEQPGVDAALDEALRLDVVEGCGAGAVRGDAERSARDDRQKSGSHDAAFSVA